VEESYERTHRIGGGAVEAGYRRQLSSTRGFGFRLRPFAAHETVSESRNYLINGSPSPGAPYPAYSLRHRGATIAGDLDYRFLGLTLGGTFGQFYPLLDAQEDAPGYRVVQDRWVSAGVRLGTQRIALEVRSGDEAPTGAPFPAFTIGLGIGNGKDTRVRVGTSDMGPFIALRHVTRSGLEIDPLFGRAHEGLMGGIMVKQWFRTDSRGK
jgi:hypothetical protein